MAFGFGKKKKNINEKKTPFIESKDIPIDRILSMRQQMSDNQIIQTLQREGYSSSQIFDAINQADLTSQAPQELPYPKEQLEMPEYYPSEGPRERIEELAEVIIDEKWNDLVKDLNKIVEWKNKTEKKVNELEQQILDLRNSIATLQKSIMTKVSQYDKNITNVGTSLKAMETVFSKILPTFTENVNELSRITKRMKR